MKLEKIAAEREKARRKRDEWEERRKEWDRKYHEQENSEICEMVHEMCIRDREYPKKNGKVGKVLFYNNGFRRDTKVESGNPDIVARIFEN